MGFSVHKNHSFKTVSIGFWPTGTKFIFPLKTTKTQDKIHATTVFNTRHKTTKDLQPLRDEEQKKVSPITAPAYCLESFQAAKHVGET